MAWRSILLWLSGVAVLTGALGTVRAEPPQAQMFAPGVISGPANDDAATFTPDGKTVYFFRANGHDYDILVSHLDGVSWSQPTIATFSGHWRDLEPAMAPDGSYLIFASSRPVAGGNKELDGSWDGQLHVGKGGNLWRVDREGDSWSKPIRLPDTVNGDTSTFGPAVANDGSLYFMRATGRGGRFQLYCSPFRNGAFQPAAPLPFSTGQWGDYDAAIAPDQSFIVFSSTRPPTPAHEAWVFIAYNENGHWSQPIPLGQEVNRLAPIFELRLGPDGHTLYLGSGYVVPPEYPKTAVTAVSGLRAMQGWNDGNDNIWSVDISPWIEHRAQ